MSYAAHSLFNASSAKMPWQVPPIGQVKPSSNAGAVKTAGIGSTAMQGGV
jgi:hypothetical protein